MDDLLDLAIERPREARARAEATLESNPDHRSRSVAEQALAIVLRDSGDLDAALTRIRVALAAATACGEANREADVRATLAGTLLYAGRSAAALRELEIASSLADGEVLAKVQLRRAVLLLMVDRHAEALPAAEEARRLLARSGNPLWEARACICVAGAEERLGRMASADTHLRQAVDLLARVGATGEMASAYSNLAEVAVLRGDVARGLAHYAEAVRLYRAAGATVRVDLLCAYANAYLTAGLPTEAADLLARPEGVTAFDISRVRLVQARALLASGDPAASQVAAREATTAARRQQRSWLEARSRLAEVRARFETGERRRLAASAARVAEELHAQSATDAPLALGLAARAARTPAERQRWWAAAASYRNHPNALVRAAAWLARALEREEAGDRGAALRACRAGLDAIDEQRRLLGSSELRAQATTHGRELTEVALRAAAPDPRRLLGWVERTRATTLAQPAMTSDATTIPESLAALRDNGRQLAEARAAGEPTEKLERDRLRLERAVRAESHTRSAEGADPDRPASAEEVVAGVGDGCLVELVDVDGALHVLVVHDGRVRRRVAGPTADALALLDPVAMLLRRSARGRPAATDQVGARLQDAILGDAARLIPDGPVVLAPTTRLHGLPWAVLPTLADRPFSVVPSAGQWLRARAVSRPAERRTVLVCGPGLESGGAEVPLLAQQHPEAQLLAGRQATLEQVLTGLDGADLVHLAAHGHFRADSPLFSSLDLADGPLTVHDIERIGRAPYRVVLSACESGVLAPVGAQELLGLAAALFGLGTAGLVCSVAEVNDDATAELMVGLHAALAEGKDPATALWEVRRHTTDPIASATTASFLALGV
ncbi:hypothetical protein GCM10028801_04300 [Nocardioides maradonensis]